MSALGHATLWHGTAERVTGPLRGGGYDGILWTSPSPEIARSYIPGSGSSMLWTPVVNHRRSERATPDRNSATWQMALSLGFSDVEAVYDERGFLRSWKGPTPTLGEITDRLASLGYEPGTTHWVKMAGGKVLGSKDRIAGALYRIDVAHELRVADLRQGDFDRSQPSYHDLAAFQRMRDLGFDAVAIDDMSKDESGDQLGHDSIGLFPSGIAKCQMGAPQASSHLAFAEWFGRRKVSPAPEIRVS